MNEEQLYGAVIDYLTKRGKVPAPVGLIERVDDSWMFGVNNSNKTATVQPSEACMAWEAEPYEVTVWFNGWIAGAFGPATSGWFAAGTCANWLNFIDALTNANRSL
jgi:hypothetical protein